MKISGFWVLLYSAGTVLLFLSFSCCEISSWIPEVGIDEFGNSMRMTTTSRKLKVNGYYPTSDLGGNVNLEDYHPIDPVPSSKASLRPGPIEHGTPLMPYIPRSPPPHPNNG